MYNNANVLFKTSFVDGVSKVDRYVLNRNKKKKRYKKKKKIRKKSCYKVW